MNLDPRQLFRRLCRSSTAAPPPENAGDGHADQRRPGSFNRGRRDARPSVGASPPSPAAQDSARSLQERFSGPRAVEPSRSVSSAAQHLTSAKRHPAPTDASLLDDADRACTYMAHLRVECEQRRLMAEVADAPDCADRSAKHKKSAVHARLEAMEKLLEECETKIRRWRAGDLPAEDISGTRTRNDCCHRIARDCYAELNELCKKPIFGLQRPDPAIKDFLNVAGKLANELKRYHYPRAIVTESENYAYREELNIGRVAPCVRLRHTGSSLRIRRESTLGAVTSVIPGLLQFGPMGKYRYRYESRMFIDDDIDNIISTIASHSGQVGLQAKFLRKVNVNGKVMHFLNTGLAANFYYEHGNYNDHKTIRDSIKAAVQRKSNWWRFLYRSGSLDSRRHKVHMACAHGAGAVMKAGGRSYVTEPGMPNLMQSKLNKGAYNIPKIHELAAQLAATTPVTNVMSQRGSIMECTQKAYSGLKAPEQATLEDPRRLINTEQSILKKLSPVPSPANGKSTSSNSSIQRGGFGIEAQAVYNYKDFVDQGNGNVRGNCGIKANADWIHSAIDFRRLLPPHHQLDPDYSGDIKKSEALLKDLERHHEDKPKSFICNVVKEKLNPNTLRPNELPAVKIAAQLDCIGNANQHLMQLYMEFQALASQAYCMKDAKYKSGMHDSVADEFKRQFSEFTGKVFGIDKDTRDREKKAYYEKLIANPTFFMTETYDALSIALGQIGVCFHNTKAATRAAYRSLGPSTDYICNDMERCATNYVSTVNLMNGIHLPISEDKLIRTSSLISTSASRSQTSTFEMDTSVDFMHSIFSYIPHNSALPDSTNEHAHGFHPLGALSSTVAGMGLHGSMTMRDSFENPNPARTGDYYVERISTRVGGVTPEFILAGTALGIGSINKAGSEVGAKGAHLLQNTERALLIKSTNFATGVAAAVVRAGIQTASSEIELQNGWRAPKDVGNHTFKNNLQFVRLVRKETESVSPMVGVPAISNGTPFDVYGSATAADTSENVGREYMGPCLGYQIIQSTEIRELLNLSRNDATTRDNLANGQTGKPVNPKKMDEECDMALMRNALDHPPGDTKDSKILDGPYIKEKYFGTPDTITGILDDFLEYIDNPRPLNGPEVDLTGKGPLSEFYRFDLDDAYWETIDTMRHATRNSAHNSVRTSNKEGVEIKKSFEREDFDPRPKLSANPDEARAERDAIKAAIAFFKDPQNKGMTTDQRMNYFLNDNKNSDGRLAFTVYIRVLTGYCDINTAAKANHSYESKVVEPK